MIKTVFKFIFMLRVGLRYIKIFKKTYFDPFISFPPAYKQLSRDRSSYSNIILDYLNIDVKTIGSLPKNNNILYVINHRSLLDILVMENIFGTEDKNGTWIAKEELFNASYGDFFKYSGCLSVDIDGGKGLLKFFKQIKVLFKKMDDFNIYIFPEGERNSEDGILEFQSGATKIAKSNKLKVVPIYIDEKLELVFKDAPYKEKKTVRVYIGKDIGYENIEQDYREFVQKKDDNE